MSWAEGTPECRLYWPEAKRDAAVAACAGFLKQYGERYAVPPAQRAWARAAASSNAVLSFPALDHPATADEARKGLAIFSAGGEGETRLWKTPAGRTPWLPTQARWVTLKDGPGELRYTDPATGKEVVQTRYDQDGKVWQAEEVLKDGKWRRYFGFVGRYRIGRAPAEEIEFPTGSAPLTGGLECMLGSPGAGDWKARVPEATIGAPLRVGVWLRNRRGIDVAVPTEFVRANTDGPALRGGLDVRLAYLAEPATGPAADAPLPPPTDPRWEEQKSRWTARFAGASEPARLLAPTEECRAFDVDLADWFDVARPGAYRVTLAFGGGDSGVGTGTSWPVVFRLRGR